MTKSILATYGGNDYQARVFWLQACQTLSSDSKIERVGFEIDDIKFFDDVATIYKSPVLSERNELIMRDYWQVKYHMDASGVLTYEQLTNPTFINAKTLSLLQRLHQLQKDLAPDGLGVRFYFVSPWPIQYDDPLAKLISNNGGEIRLEVLFSASNMMRQVRDTWKSHLNLSNDDELESVIKPFRICAAYPSLQQLRNDLNTRLTAVGLAPVDETTMSNPYDDLIKKVRQTGQSWFSGDDIEQLCKHEGLWKGNGGKPAQVVHLGIRSFTRWAENMENETHRMVNLVPYFDGRSIRSAALWMDEIFPQVDKFLQGSLQTRVPYTLRLDCHSSIAFAAGYLIGAKSGFEVAPLQKTVSGEAVWRTKSRLKPLPDMWSITEHKVDGSDRDVGLVISVTHTITDDVREYIDHSLPHIHRIFACQLLAGIGGKAIEDGDHAYNLAQQLVQWLKQNRDKEEKQSTLHIFTAAPNGFMFFLGQQAKVLGPIQLYEFDFDNPSRNSYQPSLMFPKFD